MQDLHRNVEILSMIFVTDRSHKLLEDVFGEKSIRVVNWRRQHFFLIGLNYKRIRFGGLDVYVKSKYVVFIYSRFTIEECPTISNIL